jgi:23S rRNA (cytosine1962-C5)-methyltransferase
MRHLLEAAAAQRSPILTPQTNAVRLVDGGGDGLPGIYLETYADRLLLSTTTRQIPRPVIEWLGQKGHPAYAKHLDQHQKESPSHLCGGTVDEPFLIRENGLNFEISFQSGYSQGIFLDQRDNRAELRHLMSPGLRLLNTFAYTGAFSIAAAAAGAETTTLDLSQTYLDWAKRNFTHNGIDPAHQHFCKGDTFHWLRRFAKQGKRFDAIVLDPPTFSRDEKGKVFRVEKDYGELVSLAVSVLNKQGIMLCCTNFRGLSTQQFQWQIREAAGRGAELQESPMPPDFTDVPYLKSVWVKR